MSDRGPDGSGETGESVGRYVRERWGAAEPARGRRRSRRSDDAEAPRAASGPPAEGASTATGTRTPPDGIAWGAELPDVDDELASEIDPQTPPHGTDLSALHGPRHGAPDTDDDLDARLDDETSPHAVYSPSNGHRPAEPDRTAHDRSVDDSGRDRPRAAAEARTPAPRDGADPIAADPIDAEPRPGVAPRPGADPWGVEPVAAGGDDARGSRTDTGTRSDERPDDTGPWAAEPSNGAGPRGAVSPAGRPAPVTGRDERENGPADAGYDPDLPPPRATHPARPRWTAPEAVETREAQRRRAEQESGDDLEFGTPLMARNAKRPPRSGWRRLVYVLTRGAINPGESPADIRQRELTARVNKPLLSSHKIAMLSLKGGVGKTTVTATLGATFASLRGDRVVAVDANPDRGTLSQKIPLETTATVRHLLRDAQRVRRYTDVRAYTSQGSSRLEVLASEQDPAVSEAFSEDDYRNAVDLLEHFYNLVLTDCGTGLMHSAMYGVLGMADQLVIVSSGSIDGARSASATLDWLDAHGNGDLVRNAVVVINTVHRRAGSGVDLNRVAEHFAGRCRAVVRVPFDGHLEEGAEIDLDRLEPATRTALLELAAAVADGFPS